MPVVINDFETVVGPPRSAEPPATKAAAAEGSPKASVVAATELMEALRRQRERLDRVRAH